MSGDDHAAALAQTIADEFFGELIAGIPDATQTEAFALVERTWQIAQTMLSAREQGALNNETYPILSAGARAGYLIGIRLGLMLRGTGGAR